MGRRWLVTGCSSGLGRALATAAARAGHSLAVTARRTAGLDELAAAWPDRVVPLRLELRDAASCEEAVRTAADRLGGIDILVNNAGAGLFGAVEEVSDTELRDQLETLLIGPWRLTRLVLPLMRAQGNGHILNVSSVVGRMAFPGLAAYVAGKHALEGMSQALAIEGAPHNIRVTVLEPGMFATRYGISLAEARHRVPAYDVTNREMLEGTRGVADNPETGHPDDFAAAVLDMVAADVPLPVRIPVGDDAYGYVDQAEQASREEFAAARTLVRGLPSRRWPADGPR
ncbi:SDR family oxidoreductase [Streptomyces echinatus]|uniref:NAD(P)-dependent dehydrogenase (Short-subunit alcohol dehydrogenase family) n=1 Tax=Streptomyces echinatus TaxID=67293 RepID=A0A7W9PS74_9ACTN|nr:SDR family oxidoreductase [Streptomyces echinatus]MBB5926724.1 NAD(P)-dependent dehydrogenase (short-subunit alcohol dehydrogenase family) [Streptomyces echinatus]